MTSLTALRNAAKSGEGESPTAHEIRVEEIKEAYIEGDLSEEVFDELLDAAYDEGPPYRASVLLDDRKTMEVPTPEDRDEQVVQNRGKYWTIDGNIARIREEAPDWENVVNVNGGNTPSMDKVEIIERNGQLSEEAKQKQEELRRNILGRGE